MSLARLAALVAAGVATALVLRFVRDFPWYLAGIAGLAVTVLGGMFLRSWNQLVQAWRPRDPGSPDDRD